MAPSRVLETGSHVTRPEDMTATEELQRLGRDSAIF